MPNHAGVAVAAGQPGLVGRAASTAEQSAYATGLDIDWSRGPAAAPGAGRRRRTRSTTCEVEDGELRYYDKRYPIADGTGDGTPREVHDRQHYELVNWRRGDAELNYRRFFAIVDLAGLRVEDPAVFDATHAEILRWYAEGAVQGIRVDHPDGLRDPAGYLRRLRDAAPDAWLVVEKILEPGEELPAWPVAGTTGYDALAEVCGVFVDPSTEAFFDTLDHHLTGGETSWQDLVHDDQARRRDHAARRRAGPAGRARTRDRGRARARWPSWPPASRSTGPTCRSAPGTWPRPGPRPAAAARDLIPALDQLTARLRDPDDELAVRFQQYTGAVMAKGVEDTAFYRWTRFTARNEVGGDPAQFGVTPDEFHDAAERPAAAAGRTAMTTLSTHDTKRSEDVRARLAVLAELPGRLDRGGAPLGARRSAARPGAGPPALAGRGRRLADRAGAAAGVRGEGRPGGRRRHHLARTRTSGSRPRCTAMVDRIYDDPALHARGRRLRRRDHRRPAGPTRSGQKLVQLTMPGVPDVYQGTELWDYSLVDPDNRRPVDFAARRELLARLDDGWLPPVDDDRRGEAAGHQPRPCGCAGSGRSCSPATGRCSPTGRVAEHVLAFDRGGAVAVATRLPVGLSRHGGWRRHHAVTRRPQLDGSLHEHQLRRQTASRWPTCCTRTRSPCW